MSEPVVLPRVGPRRSAVTQWWARAWVRAVEEASYVEADLRAARVLARSGRIGPITLGVGGFVAAAQDETSLWTVQGTVAGLDRASLAGLVEVVAARPGALAALRRGDLPLALAEEAEEAGVELLPSGGELATSCTCGAWTAVCVHGLAVLLQLGWLIQTDPLVLLHVRGLPGERLVAGVHDARGCPRLPDCAESRDPSEDDETALEAAVRARRLLVQWAERPQR